MFQVTKMGCKYITCVNGKISGPEPIEMVMFSPHLEESHQTHFLPNASSHPR